MAEDSNDLDHEVTAPRASTTLEWEVFVRTDDAVTGDGGTGEAEADAETPAPAPLTHAGSVSAPTRAVAFEQAARLFDRAATTVWLCPADEVSRHTTTDRALANRTFDAGTPADR